MHILSHLRLALAALILLSSTLPAFFFHIRSARAVGTVIYVDTNNNSGTYNGSSWNTAYRRLQNALAVATAGDQIWVANGVYYPDEGTGQTNNNRDATFTLINGVGIYGGFAGNETSLSQRNIAANVTILSGDIDKNDTNTDGNFIAESATHLQGANSRHVMAGNLVNSTAVVDGFTITAGQAHYDMQITEPRNRGGGLTMDLSSPTLANLTFVGNVAGYGGAIYCNGSAPNVSNTSFRNNYSYEGGGGALLNDYGSGGTYQNVQFINNVSYGDGGAIYNRLGSNMVLNQATFTGNIADDQLYNDGSGGAIISYNSNTVLNDVTFSGNTAADTGGAMANETSYPQLTNVTFNNNTSSLGGAVYDYMGAGIYTSTVFINNSANLGGAIHAFNNNNVLRDATFENNFASSKGGAYYISSGSPALVNITFSSNDATDDGGAVFIRNSSRPSFTNVTINDNGSSYYALSITEVSTPTLKNTIIANNGVYDCYKSSDSTLGAGSGYNLVEDAANACGMVNGVSNNIVGLDPVVGPLQANGGLGDTHALLIGSPALDAGNPAACPAFDQRGVARPQDGDLVGGVVCDIGAFERIPVLFWIYLPLSFK